MISPSKGNLQLSSTKADFSQGKPTAILTGTEALKVVGGEGKYPQKAISVAAWVKADKTPKWAGITTLIQDNGKYKRGFFLGSRFNKFSFSVAGVKRQSLHYMTCKTPFSTGFWYYVVGSYDGAYQRLYIDGKLDSTYKSNGGDISYPEVQLPTVGAFKDDDETHPFHGKINELSVYDTALSEEFIQKEFEKRKNEFPGIEGTLNNDGQWPTYLGNNERQAASPTELPFPLKQAWSYKARHKPAPAWPLPAKMDYWRENAPKARVIFDRAYHLVGQGNLLYFGSSADHKIYCLDNRTGKEVWSYFTEGPVRLAPSVYEGKVYTGSDDGYVYCNDAATGKLIWKQRLAKEDVRLPGNERMISQWPVRTGVIIEDKIAHFCAGLFPSQGVFRGGADVESGKILANLKLWYSAQGYMQSNSGQIEFSQGRHPAKKFLVTLKRNFKSLSQEMLLLPKEYSYAFIKAGNVHIGGGDGKIIAIDGTKNKVLWRAEVTGRVYSLAVINGRLYASTDEGFIYCFTGKAGAAKAITNNITKKLPYTSKSDQERTEKITRFLLNKRPQLHRGYALVTDLTVKEIYSLCKYSDYQVIAIENDAAKID
ncbi:MAG: PQQ-binding-like beta-propeller repeat protein [Lentisphaerales bacterium]|nr:PQQ-binding-like beta-propeller repeat protein [Lentisphaerales bacterium]